MMLEGVNERRGKASYGDHIPFNTSEAEGIIVGRRTGGGDACSEGGDVSHILPSESSLAFHNFCSSIAHLFVKIVFPFHSLTSYVGGVFSELCAPKLCEKTPAIISWATQGMANISAHVATLILLRRLCLHDFFFSSETFSLPLSETNFSYLFYLISTQATVFMFRTCMRATDQAYLKCSGYHTFLSEQANLRKPIIYQGDPLYQTKKIEEECFKYLSQIREIIAIAAITLLAYEERDRQTISPVVSRQKRMMEELKTNAEEHVQRLMGGVTECYHARRGIEEQNTSCPAKNLWRDGVKLDAWKDIFEEILENLLSQCGGNQGRIVGIAENYLRCIKGNYREQLTQLEATIKCTDRDPRKNIIGLLSGLAGSCDQLYGTHAFMKSYLPPTNQNIDSLIQMLQEEIENAYQRVELSYSKEFDSDKQNEILNRWIKKFPQMQREHRELLKAWQDLFSFLLDQTPFCDLRILGVRDYISFQAKRMTEEIGQHLKHLRYKMKKCMFKKFNGYVVLETIEE